MQYATLDSLALLKFEGEDSLSFLQGQLSQDMRLVSAKQAFLASYSNPKGRVFSTFLFWQDTQNQKNYYALVPHDNSAFLQKRLSMFVLRAKVKIYNFEASIHAIWGENLQDLHDIFPFAQQALSINRSISNSAHNQPQFICEAHAGDYLISFPSSTQEARVLWVNIPSDADTSHEALGNSSSALNELKGIATQKDEVYWQIQDILIGLPWIGDASKEVFVAQSINQDVLGAINFKKGCYPGQEVIARSHYLGNLKRRTVIAIADKEFSHASQLVSTDVLVDNTPVGQVVNAASTEGKTFLLLEVQLQSIENKQVYLANMPDVVLHIMSVPYSLEKPAQ